MPLHLCILFLFLICKRYQFQTNDPAINTENDEELILKDDATLADSKIGKFFKFLRYLVALSHTRQLLQAAWRQPTAVHATRPLW